MKYDKYERQAIKNLSHDALPLFRLIERREQGEIIGVSQLCESLARTPKFFLFSCLSGDGESEELNPNLGVLFSSRFKNRISCFLDELTTAGFTETKERGDTSGFLTVFIDDTEPVRVWQWDIAQSEVTDWYRMVIDDTVMPHRWETRLWSDVERKYSGFPFPPPPPPHVGYEDAYQSVKQDSLVLYQLLEHMRRYPNQKLKRKQNLREVSFLRAVQYRYQGIVLNQMLPSGVLVQTETPYEVKDPLFGDPSESFPIIHPFSEERR